MICPLFLFIEGAFSMNRRKVADVHVPRLFFRVGVIHNQSPSAVAERGGRWLWVTPSGCLLYSYEISLVVIIGKFSWAMEDGQRAIDIPMDAHSDPDVMATVLIGGDLQYHALEAYAVIGADGAFILLTEDVVRRMPGSRHFRQRS